jgi:hypothetical protein
VSAAHRRVDPRAAGSHRIAALIQETLAAAGMSAPTHSSTPAGHTQRRASRPFVDPDQVRYGGTREEVRILPTGCDSVC